MAISVLKRPYDKNWSGNPVHYHLYSASAEADPTIYFEIKIYFKRSDTMVYSEVYAAPYSPVNGSAKIDIQNVLDGLMEYETPSMPADFEYYSPLFSKKMTGHFYIAWREIESDPDPSWITTESSNARFVIKGGIAFHKWRGDNYWTNYFVPEKPFLTWQINGRLAGLEERMYLAWLNLTTVDIANIKMRRRLVFTDGAEYIVYLDCPASQYDVVFFPAGAKQLRLQEVNLAKKIEYWELQVWDINDNVQLSQAFRFEADHTNYYKPITLNYRNSLGGLDSVRIRGVIEYFSEREFTQQEQIVLHDYFTGNFVNGKVIATNSTESLIYKGDIGHLKKEEHDRLRDIHFRREVWWEQQLKWMPVLTMTGSQKLKTTNDQKWSMPIEFSIASGGDSFYTPDNVNLAESSAVAPVCNAIISVPTAVAEGGGWRINWDLVSGSPAKYFVSTPGYSGGSPGETESETFLFPWLPVGDNVVKVQPVCLIGGEPYLGTPQFVTVTVAPSCTPVGISGSPSLPNGVAGAVYSYSFALTGTAPFAISNVTKPAWMTIAVSGSNIVFGGTPTSTGTMSVFFTITNCNGAFVEFEDFFNVSNPETGLIHVQNDRPGALIHNITPFFYMFGSGEFPIPAEDSRDGTHTGTSSVIHVNLTTPGSSNLSLYINSSLHETLGVPGNGTYSFTAVTIPPSANIVIELTT